jgi:8-amino-7-oxononanoate synthase
MLLELGRRLEERRKNGLYRSRKAIDSPQGRLVKIDNRELINFCSNDYLGLANCQEIVKATKSASSLWGVGSGASHMLGGHFSVHQELEDRLAKFVNRPAALFFSNGYMANLAVVTALVGRGDSIFADRLNHSSLNDAAKLSGAKFMRYRHQDIEHLEALLSKSVSSNKLIVSDSVFSMDGDKAKVEVLLELAERYDAWVYLDDAHGFGVLGGGRGILRECSLKYPERVIYMGTLGKAAGVSGAFVAGEYILIEWLINTSRTYIYTTASSPVMASALHASLDLIESDSWRRDKLQNNIQLFRSVIKDYRGRCLDSDTPIQIMLAKSNDSLLEVSSLLFERGFWVGAVRSPTVPSPRLRINLSTSHNDQDIVQLAGNLNNLLL